MNMSSDIYLELDMCLINTVEPEEEYELFSRIDEALFNDDYAKAFWFIEDNDIDPREGLSSFIDNGLEVAKSALSAGPAGHPLVETEKDGGAYRIEKSLELAEKVSEEGWADFGDLRDEIMDIDEAYRFTGDRSPIDF